VFGTNDVKSREVPASVRLLHDEAVSINVVRAIGRIVCINEARLGFAAYTPDAARAGSAPGFDIT
jgi:hypothetical protein